MDGWNVLYQALFFRKIAPYTYQIKKEECLQLPLKKYYTEYYELTEEQSYLYADIKGMFLMEVDELKPSTIYRLFTACQHVLSGNTVISKYEEKMRVKPFFKDPKDNPRIQKLMEVINDQKTIIWCKYTQEIKDIAKILKELHGPNSVVEFYGEIGKRKRQDAIKEFSDGATYFIANKTCAGYGLNLQFCNNIIYYSNDWDYATRIQSEDRVHRMGQENVVNITDICASSTLDERILKCLWRKERLVDSFKSSIENFKDKNVMSKWIDGIHEAN
jgi:SNF2 family DNA or RNA helicase